MLSKKSLQAVVGWMAVGLLQASAATGGAQTSAASSTAATAMSGVRSSKEVARYASRLGREPVLTDAQKMELIRKHVKYVFVLFQENRSFDFYFGSFPGANGLYSQPASETAGFVQPIVTTDGTVGTISPFRIPAFVVDDLGKKVPLYPQDTASVNHSHLGLARKLSLGDDGVARNDQYALTEEGVKIEGGKVSRVPTLERKQFGELVMAHVDCDTVPFLWRYADRFTLFDHFFDTVIGPSGPNAIAMIAGQTGETEWMLHPELGEAKNGVAALPMVTNAHPYWERVDPVGGQSAGARASTEAEHAPDLTFAALPLSFMGSDIKAVTATDGDPGLDLRDVQEDIDKIAGHGVLPVNWGWYQQGYDHEPTDPVGVETHKQYVIHHNGPQYFGYVANNPASTAHMHGLGDFFTDVAGRRLPASGVFYVRGGYGNILSLPPADPNPRLATVFNGDDDHPGYADTGISEAFLAREINAIADSPYWSQSAILIAYDESDGLYDHAQPKVRSHAADGSPLDQGPRIPFILISPYGNTHVLSHEPVEHSSIIRFVDDLYGMIPLADLPDEEKGREIGRTTLHQNDLGPADDKVAGVGSLLSGFDNARLLGKAKLVPAAYAKIPEDEVMRFPHMDGQGCKALSIKPTDAGMPNPVPKDFNPRPDTSPGNPTSGNWTP